MTILGQLKRVLNKCLAFCNVEIGTLTAFRREEARLKRLESRGGFWDPVFPVPEQFQRCDPAEIFSEIVKHESRFDTFEMNHKSGNGYSFQNNYYTSPDAEVLYAITRLYRPRKIVEIGSGYSTRLFRQAIVDGNLNTEITSIDPCPRTDVAVASNVVVRCNVEEIQCLQIFEQMGANDILFIDSSHEIKPGNDVLFLLLSVLPLLRAGVIIHIHDVFLPYEYPRSWIVDYRWNWAEQYLVQALLMGNPSVDVIWPGYYLQRTMPGFSSKFKFWQSKDASSLWLVKR